MEAIKNKLTDCGNVLIVIRSNVKKGEVSDYVLKTRLAVRQAGWIECEELIWLKPDAPPLGSIYRPRRSWENILWFSKSRKPFVDLKACGNQTSERIGAFAGSDRFGHGGDSPIHEGQKSNFKKGTSRCTDVFTAYVGEMDKGVMHPAMYPTTLAEQLIRTFSGPGDLVVDPFVGSGTTALAARSVGRNFIGFDCSEEYVGMAQKRLS